MPEEKDNPTPEAPESADPSETVVEQAEASVDESLAEVPVEESKVAKRAVSAAEKVDALAGDDSAESGADATPAARRGRRLGPSVGIAHIRATFNNTQVAISDMTGGVISWSTAGRAGFKGSRKSTAFAATMVGQDAARQAVAKGMHEVEVHVQGAGSGRESAIRALQTSGLVVTLIKDVTPMPHNGCRQRKRRRV